MRGSRSPPGRLIDALALGPGGKKPAVRAVLAILGLAVAVAVLRFGAFMLLCRSSLRITQRMVSDAFFAFSGT